MKNIRLLIIALVVFLWGCKDNTSFNPSPIPEAIAETTDTFLQSIQITKRSTSDNGVAGVSCAADESVVGGGCHCSGDALANEDGELFGCMPVGNGFLGGCYSRYASQITPIEVAAICAKSLSGSAITGRGLARDDNPYTNIEEETIKMRQLIQNRIATGR